MPKAKSETKLTALTITIVYVYCGSVSDILSISLQSRNEIRIVRNEPQQNSIGILKTNSIFGSEQTNFCAVSDTNRLQPFKVRTTFIKKKAK